uniref:Uncharacterized protein n=1 Tax=Populus trichocarpa TaxID=3694 RepID=A0A3N7FPC6_POPTR
MLINRSAFRWTREKSFSPLAAASTASAAMDNSDVLIGSVALEMAHRIFYTMLPSSVEQFIIELVAWAGSWYDFFHLDGTHPVKVEPLLKSKVWIIIFLFDYLKQGFRV